MSLTASLLLNISPEEFWCEDTEVSGELADSCEPLDNINHWIAGGKLVDLTSATYDQKASDGMHAWLYGGGFKQLDLDGFIKMVESQAWKAPEHVQLFVNCEGDNSFSIVELRMTPPPS
jgi:hypothetical protein